MKLLPGKIAFKFVTERGIPLDILEHAVEMRGVTIEMNEFNRLMNEHKELSRKNSKFKK